METPISFEQQKNLIFSFLFSPFLPFSLSSFLRSLPTQPQIKSMPGSPNLFQNLWVVHFLAWSKKRTKKNQDRKFTKILKKISATGGGGGYKRSEQECWYSFATVLYQHRVEIRHWDGCLHLTGDRVEGIRQTVNGYDKNWHLVHIGLPTEPTSQSHLKRNVRRANHHSGRSLHSERSLRSSNLC